MEFVLIPLTAFAASILTFYSGFGLGTLLTPVFLMFFPAEISIALTACVHFLNNLFKAGLTWKNADLSVMLRFGIPAFLGAAAGSFLLLMVSENIVSTSFTIGKSIYTISFLNTLIGLLLIVFAFLEKPFTHSKNTSSKSLQIGGLLSGFFGGLSGHQGALRSLFLSQSISDKAVFIATGIGLSLIVDVTRITIYLQKDGLLHFNQNISILGITLAAAFAGALFGNRFLKKVTMESVQFLVKWGIILIGLYTVLTSISM